jgi:hypothetical protein
MTTRTQRKSKSWPNAPRALAGRLRRDGNLRNVGIEDKRDWSKLSDDDRCLLLGRGPWLVGRDGGRGSCK